MQIRKTGVVIITGGKRAYIFLKNKVFRDLFHQPTLMHNFFLFINNMFVTLLSSTCFEH